MKTLDFIKTTTFSLVFFISVSSIANPTGNTSGEESKTSIKNQIIFTGTDNYRDAVNTEDNFSYLRFDTDNFVNESEVDELPATTTHYLRFDVNNFINDYNETTELPVSEEFYYLRFDVNNYSNESSPVID